MDENVGQPTLNRSWLRRLSAGKTLFSQGDVDKRVYVLVAGNVEVLREGQRVAEIDVGDTFIGEISALTGHPRSATVKTLSDSTLLVVDDIEELFQANVAWGLKLARVLAQRLLQMNMRLERAQKRIAEEQGRLQDRAVAKALSTLSRELSAEGDETQPLLPAV